VLGWLKDDLRERGPRNRGVGSEGKAYFSPGFGGYGAEDIREDGGGLGGGCWWCEKGLGFLLFLWFLELGVCLGGVLQQLGLMHRPAFI
jgi:hypothetical protein